MTKNDNLVSGYDYNSSQNDDLETEEGIVPIGDGKMQCLKCFMTFGHLSSAKRHYRNRHMVQEPFPCRFCKRILKNIESLNEHIRTIHGISKKQLKNRILPNPRSNDSLINS